MNIFCDIDGTLTDNPNKKWGVPNLKRIEVVKKISMKNDVILWSGNGAIYAQEFRDKYKLNYCIAIGKPHLIIDDNPTIRPYWNSLIRTPDYLGE